MSLSLLSLYQSILVPIFSQWISDEDLCCVDSAVCNRKLRNFVLLTMQKCAVSGPVHEICDKMFILNQTVKIHERIEWVRLRGFKFKDVGVCFVSTTMNQLPLSIFVQDSFSRLESISTRWSTDLFDRLERANLAAKHLKLAHNDKALQAWGSNMKINLSICCWMAKIAFSKASRAGYSSLSLTIYFERRVKNERPPTVEVFIDHNNNPVVTNLEVRGHFSREETELLSPYMNELRRCSISDSYEQPSKWESLVLCCNLTELKLTYVQISTVGMGRIMLNCPMLKSCSYRPWHIPSWVLSSLSRYCPNIESFEASVKCNEHDFLCFLQACPKLTHLRVRSDITSVTLNALVVGYQSLTLKDYDSSLQMITRSRLKAISVSSSCRFTVDQYAALFSHNPMLLRIKLQSRDHISDDTIRSLVQLCPLLENVTLRHCYQLTVKSFHYISDCKYLRAFLCYETCQTIRNTDVEDFLKKQTNLTALSLSFCCGVFTGTVMSFIAKYCLNMKHVDVPDNRKIQTSDVIVLLKGCTQLNYLNLSRCINVGIEIFAHIKSEQMRYLNVYQCNIPSDFVKDYKAATGFQWIE